MKTLTNSVLIEKLKSVDETDNEEAMTYLYSVLYWKVQNFILKNNGQEEEVKDVFQDALLSFFKKVKQNRVDENVKAEAYIFSTCRNLWLGKLQQKKREVSFESSEIIITTEEPVVPELFKINRSDLLKQILQELGGGCQAVLLAFYYEQLTMEEIVKRMSLSSIQIAKNKKYKCLQKLKTIVANSTYYKNNLK